MKFCTTTLMGASCQQLLVGVSPLARAANLLHSVMPFCEMEVPSQVQRHCGRPARHTWSET
jgi:hypothetical protein